MVAALGVLVAALAVLALAPLTAGAAAATSATTATLVLPATSPVLSEVHGRWTTTVLVQDTGACATAVAYRLVVMTPGDPGSEPGTASVAPRPPAGCALTAGAVSTVGLVFGGHYPVVPSSAVLVVQAARSTAVLAGPTTIVLVVRRAIGLGREVLAPLVVGLAAAALFALVASALLRVGGTANGGGDLQATAASTWSFKDSPVTNITAVGAVFGAVITATGSVTSAFPGVPLYRFAMLNVAYAALAATAPVVAGLGSKSKEGDDDKVRLGTPSLLCAGGLTLMATAGELTSLAMLEWWSSAVPWARIVLVVATAAVGLLLLAYCVPATVSLFSPVTAVAAPPAEGVTGPAGPVPLAGRVRRTAFTFASEFAFSGRRERAAAL